MNPLRKAVVLGLLCGPMFSGPAHAIVAKCRPIPGGIPIRTNTPIVVINGEVTGELPASPAVNGAPVAQPRAFGSIKSEEILNIYVGCLEITEARVKGRRGVVSLITKNGAPLFMTRLYYGGAVGMTVTKPPARFEAPSTAVSFQKR